MSQASRRDAISKEAGCGEVEGYIGEHEHLPQMPSAAEVEADGADLGEMNRLLLQKVEELTLYIIDLQKQIDELNRGQQSSGVK